MTDAKVQCPACRAHLLVSDYRSVRLDPDKDVPELPQYAGIGEIVAERAYEIFCDCGAEDDFCIQSVGYAQVVFGGTNRICWSIKRGFWVDRTYCTHRFLNAWYELHADEPGRI